jgi:hydroxymethylbilane synthase
MSEKIVIGTRGSKLALAQTKMVADLLSKDGVEYEIKIVKTSGDRFTEKPLTEFGGMGAFVREIDKLLVKGVIDVAVHSLKDVPTKGIEGTVIAAVLPRESPFDVLVSRKGNLDELPSGAVIGTSSMRRRAQLKRYRKDVIVENLRGNVDTRLRKLREGMYDAIILAEAGIKRLGISADYKPLNLKDFVPSANQGIVAIATRKGEEYLVRDYNHETTYVEGMVEREIIRVLGAGCIVPVGVHARYTGSIIEVIAEILSSNGEETVRVEKSIPFDDWIKEARKIGNMLVEKGGGDLIEKAVR